MLIKTRNSVYQLTRKGGEYTLMKLEALMGKPATMTVGQVWIGDEASFQKDGCLHFRQGGVTILRTSLVELTEE